MNYIDKLKKQLRENPQDLTLQRDLECYQQIDSVVKALVDSEQKITIKAVCKLSGCDNTTVKNLLPKFKEIKSQRIQVRCTIAEKRQWENKARKAELPLSELVASALSKAIVIKPKISVLAANMNRLVGESVKQNALLCKLTNWAEANRTPVEQLQILTTLQSIEMHYRDMIKRIKLAISDANQNRFTGLNSALIEYTDEQVK